MVTARFDHAEEGPKLANYLETGYCDLKGLVKSIAGIRNRSAHEALGMEIPSFGARRTPAQRLMLSAYSFVTFPDDYIGWFPFAARAVRKSLAAQKWDAILTTAPPMTANLVAALTHGRVPWVADLRDLWAEGDYSERPSFWRFLDDKAERASLSRAAALTTVSRLAAKRLDNRYPGKPCFSISNGFDVDEWQTIDFGNERACTLLYAGSLYRGKRDPAILFSAVREIIDGGSADRSEFRIDFYAQREPWLLEMVDQYDLRDVVRVHGIVERSAVLAAQRRADRLIVLTWDGPASEGVVTGKLFEYFGARRPVLAIGGPRNASIEDILRETNAGVRCRTAEEAKAEILTALYEYRAGRQRIIPEASVRAYSGVECARQFADVLDYVVTLSPQMRNREPEHQPKTLSQH